MTNNIEHPSHYNQYNIETEEMMIKIFGKDDLAKFYLLSAFKYRMRLGYKSKEKLEEDFNKEQYCLKRYRELKNIP